MLQEVKNSVATKILNLRYRKKGLKELVSNNHCMVFVSVGL